MKTFTCNIAQSGLFAGRVALFNASVKKAEVSEKTIDSKQELLDFEGAVLTLKKQLEQADLGQANSEIMEAMTMILEDESFLNGVQERISEGSCSASDAVEKETERIISVLENSDSDYLKNRCADVRGISGQLIAILNGGGEVEQLTEKSAVAAYEISPILISSLEAGLIGALISDKGSSNSHASIIAGNLGVPYLYGAGEAISEMENGQTVIVDGDQGLLILEPEEEQYREAAAKMEEMAVKKKELEEAAESAVCNTKIMANISGPEDIPALVRSGADGVGLFRTELLFLNSQEAPSEEEQYKAYVAVLEAMEGKEVIVRTMDLGSDKTAAWLELPKETNPALGLRGARVSIKYKELLNTQLRALLKASVKGDLKVMFPMIASEWEVDALIEAVDAAAADLKKEGIEFSVPEIGIMVETPSAAVIADKLAEKVSFFSIGTNDLTQYSLALDREAEGMEQYFDPRHESVLRLIEITAQKAHEKGIAVGICGQIAADPQLAKRLVAAGIDELSVPIAKVKETRRQIAEAEAQIAAISEGGMTVISEIGAVADGEVIPMEEIPDEAFASGVLGACIGILPDNGNVYSPCDGTVISVADTLHAIVVEAEDGTQYLVHMGIETVNMKEKAFKVNVTAGQAVKQGELIAVADLKKIKKEGYSTIIVTVRL